MISGVGSECESLRCAIEALVDDFHDRTGFWPDVVVTRDGVSVCVVGTGWVDV